MPHWFQENKTVFITFRLGDSLPQSKIEELLDLKRKMRCDGTFDAVVRQKYNAAVIDKMEEWIDAGYGSCILADKKVRDIVVDSILFFDNKHYLLHSFVIMPNHVHILLTPIGNAPILDDIGKIKRFTAVRINRILGTEGKIWQKGTFDRLVRDSAEFERYWDYIIDNPRCLPSENYTLYTK